MSVTRAGLRRGSLPAGVTQRARCFRPKRFLLGSLALLGAAGTLPSDAVAACSPATGDNVTVTCSGATLDQGPEINTGYGSGLQAGLTINIQAPASVAGTSIGIDVGDNNTINNLGTVTTAGNGAIGDAWGINAGSNLTVNNSGTIGRLDIPNNLFDLAGINAGTGLSVTNNAGATIQGTFGIQGVGIGTVVNSGLISGLTGGGGGEGIDFAANNTSQVTVTNNASGVITGDAYGINANSAVVYNYGTISAPTSGNFGTGINASTLVLTNYASGVVTGDAFGISGSLAPNLTITNFGTISSTGIGGVAISGNTVNLVNSGTVSSVNGSGGQAISMISGSITNDSGGTISGDTGIATSGNTSVFNAGTITGTSGTAISFSGGGNTLTLGPGSVINGTAQGSGADTFQLGGTGTASFDASLLLTQYSGYATFNKVGTSTWTLSGSNATAMPWSVNAGTLQVDGSIVNATMTVNSGGTLGGIGTVGSVTVNSGGTFAPGSGAAGTSMTVGGNLAFQPGALYLVQVNLSAAASANVGGTAALGGASVQTMFAPGSYMTRSYDILHATGGLGGTTFSGVSGNVPGFVETLSYTATDVLLNLQAQVGGGGGLSRNQQNVADALNTFFNGGGALPPGFLAIFGLGGGDLANALSRLSGEAATGAQQSAYRSMDDFLLLMLDPATFASGSGGSSAMPFASEQTMPPEVATAYASVLKAPPAQPAPARWNVWGSAYGGASRLTGDAAVVGSHDLSATAGGFAAGADYRVTPEARVGFALGGGFTGWGLSNGLGGGRGDAFQAGLYGRTTHGPAYLAGALAFAEHWMSTDRFAMGDHLTANFDAQSFGGRLEGGYRLQAASVGIIPYAALQAQHFHAGAFSETDLTAGGFGLAFNAQNASDTRAELGSRFETFVPLDAGALLAVRGRIAWAHDWVTNPALLASFQALPGASFVVNGASLRHDSMLATLAPEVTWRNGWSLMAKVEGELANGAQAYAGTARVRYAW